MFSINGRNIGPGEKPYIIAEISANHGGSIIKAKAAIQHAKIAGADAVKIQTYTPDTMTLDCKNPDFFIDDGLWKGKSLYQLYAEAQTPFEWHSELFSFAKEVGITLFSTPFDETAVDLLEELKTPAYKVASFELTDLPLLKYVAKCQKPILLSTGMGSLDEIHEAVNIIKSTGNEQILIFHCVSSYPAPIDSCNLRSIKKLADEFGLPIGLSDHTLQNIAAVSSISLGSVAIEKHFKIDEDDVGPDSSFSIMPEQLKALVIDCEQAWRALGTAEFTRTDVENANKKFRRSLYFSKDIKKGEIIKRQDVVIIRPGYGIAPKFKEVVVGKELLRSVKCGDRVQWDCFNLNE